MAAATGAMTGERFSDRVGKRFATAVASYDAHSHVQRHAAVQLALRIGSGPMRLPERPRILEIGCGTGHLTEALLREFPQATLTATDIAPEMLAACRQRFAVQTMTAQPTIDWLVMDGRQPSVSGPFDLICGSLVLQWFEHLPEVLAGYARLLAPGGVLAFSLLGPETFREWRQAHAAQGVAPGTIRFRSRQDYAAAFPVGGDLSMDVEHWTDTPADGIAFLRSLRAIGADSPAPDHAPVSAATMRAILRTLGQKPAITYELIYACWQMA